MLYILDNRTLTISQAVISMMLCLAMLLAWRTQKTYPGFGRWTIAKIPNFLGWVLISLRGSIPDWASILVGNLLILASPILVYEGIRQFVGKPHRDAVNYALLAVLAGVFSYFTWARPNVNARVMAIAVCVAIVLARCAWLLHRSAPVKMRSGFGFTALMFASSSVLLAARAATALMAASWADPFRADYLQGLFFLATNIIGIGWTFGFFMMTNNRLSRDLRKADVDFRHLAEQERRDRIMAQAISEVAMTFTRTLDLGEILNRVLAEVRKLIPNALGTILLVDEEGGARIGNWMGEIPAERAEGLSKLSLRVAENPNLRQMVETGKAVIIDDTCRLDYWTYKDSGLHSYLGAPIRLQGRTVGFINLDHCEAGFYSPRHAEQLQTFADLSGIAVENARLFQRTQILANTDELTGIFNKRCFFALASAELKRAQRYAKHATLLMLDLDHFKDINDRYGHPAGDLALKTLSALFAQTLRTTDLVGRYGGDEFIMLLVETEGSCAAATAGRLLERIRAVVLDTPLGRFSLTASIGLATLDARHGCIR